MKRKKSKIIKFLEIEEIERFEKPLLEKAKKAISKENKTVEDKIAIRDFTLTNLVYACALRISEACNLTLNYLDLIKKQLYVIDGKGGDRIVPIPEPVIKNLKLWLEIRPKWEGNNYVFTNIKGTTRPDTDGRFRNDKPLTMTYFNKLFNELSEESGVTLKSGGKVHPHTLRHSRAMAIYDNGVDLEVLQALLGHKEISTTQVYARVRDERVIEAQQKVLGGIGSL